MSPCLAINSPVANRALMPDRAAYDNGTKLIQIIDDSILPSHHAVHLNTLLRRLGPRCVFPHHHLLHMQERLLSSSNRHDTAELRNMRLLLVALYAMACYLWLQTDLSAGATIFVQDQLDELTALSRALKKYRSIQPHHKQFLDDLIADLERRVNGNVSSY